MSCVQFHCCTVSEVSLPEVWSAKISLGDIFSRDRALGRLLFCSEQVPCFLPPHPTPATRSSPSALAPRDFIQLGEGGGTVLRRKRCGLPVFTVTQACGRAFLRNTLNK